MNTLSIRNILATAVLALTTFATAAHAQSTKVQAEVPFMFVYNGHTFASGSYAMNLRADGVVEIGRSRQVKTGLAQSETMSTTPTASSVVFHRAGNKYFLRQISIEGSSRRLSFMESKEEKRSVELNIAAADTMPSDVVISAEAAH